MKTHPDDVAKLIVDLAKSHGYQITQLELAYRSQMESRFIKVDYTP